MLKKGSSYFKTELSLIEDDNIKNFVIKVLDNDIYEGNFINSASSTGKYHPDFSNDKNGLVNHTKAMVKVAMVLLRARPDLNQDIVIASCILHDMMKYSVDYNHTHTDHAELMYNHLMRFYTNDILFDNISSQIKMIATIIKYHMGYFSSDDISEYMTSIKNTGFEDFILLVHYADMIVSRKWYGTDDVYVKISKGNINI